MLWFLIGVLLIATFLDIYTAFTSPIFEEAETNPIYVLTGSKAPLLLVTLFFTVWVIKNIRSSISLPKLFLFTSVIIYMTFGHLVGMYSNFSTTQIYYENPEVVMEAIENYDTAEQIGTYSLVVGLLVMIPFMLAFGSFWITMFFYDKRKPKREKITDDIYKLASRLKRE